MNERYNEEREEIDGALKENQQEHSSGAIYLPLL
jgi:hypothetical protein